MTRLVLITAASTELAQAIDALALHVDARSVRVPLDAPAVPGEWLRFRWRLTDGMVFWEGVGRCGQVVKTEKGLETVLTDLSFDPRNETMYERIMLLEGGRITGVHTPLRPPAPSIPVETRSRPADPVPRYSSVPQGPVQPKKKPPPPPPAKLSDVMRDVLRPKPLSSPPAPQPAERAGPHPLAVDPAQWAEATELMRQLTLSAPSLARGRWNEERVLQAALRMGLKSLRSLLERGE